MSPEHIWVVLDEDGAPEIAALYPEACHEHINEAIGEGIEGAEKWIVREYTQCPRMEIRAGHETSKPLTFESFFQRVRETNWNPTPKELKRLLYEYEERHCICSDFQGVNMNCSIHGTPESEGESR